jgi:hypothetical protein
MTETEPGEFRFTLSELTKKFVSKGDHPPGSGEYDFTDGLRVRTDESRNEAARAVLDKHYLEVVSEIGTESLQPAHWGSVLSRLSFTALVRVAANPVLVKERNIPQERLRAALSKKVGDEAAEFNNALVDKKLGEVAIFRPKLGSDVTSEQLDAGITALFQFRKNLLLKNSSSGSPRGHRV